MLRSPKFCSCSRKLVLADRKLKLHEIAEKDIRKQCIHPFAWTFINKKAVFNVGAVFAHSQSKTTMRWWFRTLFATVSMQQKGVFCKYVTMDETWIHHFTPESNWLSAEWTAAGKSCPKWPKMQTSAGKVLASVFWDVQGILFINYREKGRIINSEYYIALLGHLKEEITKKWPQMRKKKVFFQQDNACITRQSQCWKTTWIALQIASAPSLFSRSGPQRLLAVCKLQKNAPEKEIWLHWRNDIGNWGVFWSQRQIIQQKRHWIVREALESVYYPRRRSCW